MGGFFYMHHQSTQIFLQTPKWEADVLGGGGTELNPNLINMPFLT
jgi:hypothetical protein